MLGFVGVAGADVEDVAVVGGAQHFAAGIGRDQRDLCRFEQPALEHFADVGGAGKSDQRNGLLFLDQFLRQSDGFIDLVGIVDDHMADLAAVDAATGVDVVEIDAGTENHVAPRAGEDSGERCDLADDDVGGLDAQAAAGEHYGSDKTTAVLHGRNERDGFQDVGSFGVGGVCRLRLSFPQQIWCQ